MTRATKKLEEIAKYRDTRKADIDKDFLLNISINLSRALSIRISFIHQILKDYKSNSRPVDDNLKVAAGLYICSLVTCWETFFKDYFIFVCNNDNEVNDKLKLSITEEIPLNLTMGEYYSRKYNFQNLDQTRIAFDDIYGNQTNAITDYFTEDVFAGTIVTSLPIVMQWITDGSFKAKTDSVLEEAFKIRHQVTHDSNFLVDFDGKLFSEIESVFQSIPQFFSAHTAKKYGLKNFVFNTEKYHLRITDRPDEHEMPYVFSVQDFLATDYTIVED